MRYDQRMDDWSSAPVKINGPHATTRSGLITFARIFVHDNRLFIAEGKQRGAVVASVTEYPMPEGEPTRDPRRSRAASWGPWKWDNCGCGNSWGRHSIESLVAQATLLEPVVPEDTEPDIPVDNPAPDSANVQVSEGVEVDNEADNTGVRVAG